MKKKQAGAFTLIELLTVLALITLLTISGLVIVGIGAMGNQWFNCDSVLKKIQMTQTNAVSVVDYERNIFRKSLLTVKLKDGSYKKYRLDSDILFNYTILEN